MFPDLSGIPENSTVAVAVSGGCDSMCLLHYMSQVAGKCGFTVAAINVEHGIRGEESVRDTEFVRDYCKERDILFFPYSADVPKKAEREKISLEEAARVVRYECFADAVKSGKCDLVATAHHLRDNAESVLFNLFRGTGVKGLSGIRGGGYIIRPLINVKKSEIEEYARENGVPFVNDSTNFSDEYTRNYIRLNVLPVIEKIFPQAETSIARLSEIAYEQSLYIEKQAEKLVRATDVGAEITFPARADAADKALIRAAIISAFKKCGIIKDYGKAHADDVLALIDKQTGKTVHLPRGVTARREYGKILFKRNGAAETYGETLPFAEGEYRFCGHTVKIERVPAEKIDSTDLKSGLYLDGDKLPADATIRTKRNGDVFGKFGGGNKKLCDYYTDLKIPYADRETLPVVAAGGRVYAIFGIAVSRDVKVTQSTERLIKITKE